METGCYSLAHEIHIFNCRNVSLLPLLTKRKTEQTKRGSKMTSHSLKYIFKQILFSLKTKMSQFKLFFPLSTLFHNSEQREISNLMKGRKLPPISLTVITHHILK